jgi:hypothetical protein
MRLSYFYILTALIALAGAKSTPDDAILPAQNQNQNPLIIPNVHTLGSHWMLHG